MKKIFPFILLILTLLTFDSQTNAQNGTPVDNNGKALTEAEQKKFLAERLPSGAILGTFGSFGSLLFSLQDVAIHTDNKTIGDTELNSPFIKDYKPTWAELFDTIAVQTGSIWVYDSKRNYWVFTPIAPPPLYELKMADGWTSKPMGIYVGYKPPSYPVGMDVYLMGRYSADDPKTEAALFEKVRGELALRFAAGFKKDVTVSEMQSVKVAGVDALFFEAMSPRRATVRWRQWVFVKNGKAFVIVSALEKDDMKSFEDVKAMVGSFQVK